MTESDNYHDGTFTRWIAALSAATCNVRVKSSWAAFFHAFHGRILTPPNGSFRQGLDDLSTESGEIIGFS